MTLIWKEKIDSKKSYNVKAGSSTRVRHHLEFQTRFLNLSLLNWISEDFKSYSRHPPKYFWHWFGTERVSRRPKLLILFGFVGAVDGAGT